MIYSEREKYLPSKEGRKGELSAGVEEGRNNSSELDWKKKRKGAKDVCLHAIALKRKREFLDPVRKWKSGGEIYIYPKCVLNFAHIQVLRNV